MFIKQLFTKTPLSLSIVQEGNESAREENKLDYLPFGVKTLKVVVDGTYKGNLRLAPARLSSTQGEKVAHEDGDSLPQFVVSWGGGSEDFYKLDYPRKRIVYFLVQHVGHALDDRILTMRRKPLTRKELQAGIGI